MKVTRLLAATAAVAMVSGLAPSIQVSSSGDLELTTMTSAAYADEGKKGKRIWMPIGSTRADIVTVFLRGDEPCVGSDRNHTCYNFDPVMQTLHIQQVSRPIGLNKNVTTNRDAVLSFDGTNMVLRAENGTPVLLFQVASEQQNAAAVWNTGLANVPAAALNGVGAAGVQAAFPACRGGNCGGSTGVTTIVNAVSGSRSSSALDAVLSGGGCATGTCGYVPPPASGTHTPDGQ